MKARQPVHIIGGGGHAKVVIRLLQDLNYAVTAVFDDDPHTWGGRLLGTPVEGPVERLHTASGRPTVIAIGHNAVRRRIAAQYDLEWLTAVHPRSFVDPSVLLGPGSLVLPGAVVQVDSVLGAHTIVNTSATVDHDCRVGNFAHLAPGVHLAGGVRVGDGVLMGTGSVAVPGVRIGCDSTVGAGAVVVDDLPDAIIAVGVPAKVKPLESPKALAGRQPNGVPRAA